MFYKINNEFYLDKNDIGKLITVRRDNNYQFLSYTWKNCVVLDLSYKAKDKIRPYSMKVLNEEGEILEIFFYKPNQVEIQFLI